MARQGRSGAADGPANARMYDRFIVCQVRTVLDLKKNEVALSVPSSKMVTRTLWWRRIPAGWSWRACVRRAGTAGRHEDDGFWSAFAATSEAERLQALTMQQNTGIQQR